MYFARRQYVGSNRRLTVRADNGNFGDWSESVSSTVSAGLACGRKALAKNMTENQILNLINSDNYQLISNQTGSAARREAEDDLAFFNPHTRIRSRCQPTCPGPGNFRKRHRSDSPEPPTANPRNCGSRNNSKFKNQWPITQAFCRLFRRGRW